MTSQSSSPPAQGLHGRTGVRTAADLLQLLEDEINAVRADRSLRPLERARVIAALSPLVLRAIETSNLEARLDAVEAVLKPRGL